MRKLVVAAATGISLMVLAGPAAACGGLIGPNGAVNLLRTSTFAGYVDGVEHYVTSFEFAGGGGAFGSITPLPGIPTKVERGGDWTLQRLVRETAAVQRSADAVALTAAPVPGYAEVLLTAKVDALDLVVLRGGGAAVGKWATDHGFRLPPDAPEVLDFYAQRSPIFLAASFDADAARKRGQAVGDGTPIHLTIPTANPWVPLRILGLGKQASEPVEADVYLLTGRKPALLSTTPIGDGRTLSVSYQQPASSELLADLNSDKGMGWVPKKGMWLTKLSVNGPAGDLTGDLAIDVSGRGQPSLAAAGDPVAMAQGGFSFGESAGDQAGRDARVLAALLAGLCALTVAGTAYAGWAAGRRTVPVQADADL